MASRCQKVLNHNLLIFQVEVGSFTVLGIGPAPVAQVGKQRLGVILPLIVFPIPG